MSEVRLEAGAEGTYRLQGELTLDTVPRLCRQPLVAQWPEGATITIDLSAVTRSDSTGLALLVEWLRLARRRRITLRLVGLPEQMREIARISDLLPILPLV